jgi:hypothetical protein
MPMTCRVCDSPDLAEIESMRADGAPLRAIARQFGLSKDSLSRHVRNDHGGTGTVIPVASRGALLSPDLAVRAHAVLSAADRAVRAAEHDPGSLGLLRALRGQRSALRSMVWGRHERGSEPVSNTDRALLEANWRKSVEAFEATEGRTGPRLVALEGLRQSLAQLFKASPAPGAVLMRFDIGVGDHVTEGKPFYTSNRELIERMRSGVPIVLELPGLPHRDREPDGG